MPDAVKRGERYGRLHGTNLSRLVSDFLRALPVDAPDDQALSPVVRRLRSSTWSREARCRLTSPVTL